MNQRAKPQKVVDAVIKKRRRQSVSQIDASIQRLRDAYEIYLAGEESQAEAMAVLTAAKLSNAELSYQLGMSVKDIPESQNWVFFCLLETERRSGMIQALWTNHGCGQNPDCGDPMVNYTCRRYSYLFDMINSIPESVEDVLGHLYEMRLAAEERREPDFSGLERWVVRDMSICAESENRFEKRS